MLDKYTVIELIATAVIIVCVLVLIFLIVVIFNVAQSNAMIVGNMAVTKVAIYVALGMLTLIDLVFLLFAAAVQVLVDIARNTRLVKVA